MFLVICTDLGKNNNSNKKEDKIFRGVGSGGRDVYIIGEVVLGEKVVWFLRIKDWKWDKRIIWLTY